MKTLGILSALLAVACVATRPFDDSSQATVRAISAAVAARADATRMLDLDAYMDAFPQDFTLHSESGETIAREEHRADIVRDWKLTPRTLAIDIKIVSLKLRDDTATVVTTERWERLMLEADGTTTDAVLSVRTQRETWRNTGGDWKVYDIVELEGHTWVNSKPVAAKS